MKRISLSICNVSPTFHFSLFSSSAERHQWSVFLRRAQPYPHGLPATSCASTLTAVDPLDVFHLRQRMVDIYINYCPSLSTAFDHSFEPHKRQTGMISSLSSLEMGPLVNSFLCLSF